MKTWAIAITGIIVVAICAFLVMNKVSPVSWGMWGDYNSSSGLALKGYDPVAYFHNQEARPGSEEFSLDWGGTTWQFVDADSKAIFERNPDAYAPQFGGYCSFAIGKGFTADISPDAWHIQSGKLYLFADKKVREEWVAGIGYGTVEASTEIWKKR